MRLGWEGEFEDSASHERVLANVTIFLASHEGRIFWATYHAPEDAVRKLLTC
jgi:hypothetical protein